jgi:hypothetical protein
LKEKTYDNVWCTLSNVSVHIDVDTHLNVAEKVVDVRKEIAVGEVIVE